MTTTTLPGFSALFARHLSAAGRTRTAWTVEAFGWLILAEGASMGLAPGRAVSVLPLPDFAGNGEHALRLAGVLVSGIGMRYVVRGRLDAVGVMFGSLLDRPRVPPLIWVLWDCGILPGPLALIFSIQDFGRFLWTLFTWPAELPSGR